MGQRVRQISRCTISVSIFTDLHIDVTVHLVERWKSLLHWKDSIESPSNRSNFLLKTITDRLKRLSGCIGNLEDSTKKTRIKWIIIQSIKHSGCSNQKFNRDNQNSNQNAFRLYFLFNRNIFLGTSIGKRDRFSGSHIRRCRQLEIYLFFEN